MSAYIKGMGNISPQKTWEGGPLLQDVLSYNGERLVCHEPDYTGYVDPRQLRRMSRIIKMGVAAGTMALRNAALQVPDGIVTGTAYGCLEDTGIFLNKMLENNENALNPTPFIQSTHNTIGSQIALLLQCQGYNQTYTQGAFSFENALLDSLLQLKEEPTQSLLVGGIDEITETSHGIQRRFDLFSEKSSLDLYNHNDSTMNGEGAAFFVLSGVAATGESVCVDGVRTYYKVTDQQLEKAMVTFLEDHSVEAEDVDLLLFGRSGKKEFDLMADSIQQKYFAKERVGLFKHLSGEYPTASAFALWAGARIVQENFVPESIVFTGNKRNIERVLILNSYFGTHHSFILLRKC